MPFTNLNRRLAKQDRYLNKHKIGGKKNYKKMIIRILVILLILFVVIYLPVRGAYSASKRILTSTRAMNDAVKRENLDDIKTQVTEIKKATGDLNMSLNFLFWVRVIPYFGSFYADAQHFSKAAQYELNAGEQV